jgi:integrase
MHGTRRAATAALADLVVTAGHSRLRAGTVGELLQRWLSAAAPGWSASTVRETRSLMRCHLLPHLGYIPVAKLTAGDIDDVYAHLLRRGGRDDRPLSPATVHRVHVVLHRALTQAVRWEWIWLNPAALASPPRVEPADIRPPSVEQIPRLFDVVRAEDIVFFTYLHLAVMTGARRSQLLALRWPDVDFTHAAIGFCRALVDGPTVPVLRPTKNRRTYRVALDPRSVELLSAHRDRTLRHLTDGIEGFLFSSDPAGRRPCQPNWVTKRFIAYRRRAGLAHFRLHDLRHFMATTMLAAGVPVPVVSERLCHARTSTTVNIYAHAMPGGDRAAANLLAEVLIPATDRAAGPPRRPSGRGLIR